MPKTPKDPKREHRISMEIIVDAYGSEEQAMGWHYYLADKLNFPFIGKCRIERIISPLQNDEEIEVVSMAPEEECYHEIFVKIRWKGRTFAVPLGQVKPNRQVNDETKEAIGDWHYWLSQGYEF